MRPPDLAQDIHALTWQLDAAAEQLLRNEFGITHSQLAFLTPLRLRRELDVSALAEACRVSVPAISKRVAWFVERDLVSSRPADGRRVLLSLTPEGEALAANAARALGRRLDELLSPWPAARRTELQTLVRELTDLLRTTTTAPEEQG